MFSFKFWMVAEIFMQIGPRAGEKLQGKHSRAHTKSYKMADFCTFQHFFYENGVLETSAAALDGFSKMTVSLKQARWHLTVFQR